MYIHIYIYIYTHTQVYIYIHMYIYIYLSTMKPTHHPFCASVLQKQNSSEVLGASEDVIVTCQTEATKGIHHFMAEELGFPAKNTGRQLAVWADGEEDPQRIPEP